uniref:Uncharacterized protein n=1 Tax=Chromera velia CCMP2878 TaxID=1169474 RepID=A0A0G4HZ05_9ALVE|eukprot:Cvel_9623.t1-p1 / transcript=Cvel_9623.t1 / gene=Cvel_9623 / organism=Chromera_velia_CCMP2878 / gene_product=hypothetical protein / transcript_product=hypothetical protein / location=Cvel_scaffold559:57795-63693(-) / protein_length=973 / sequence_SO=supercontig / SO=protein_coding / is_pseudo=false
MPVKHSTGRSPVPAKSSGAIPTSPASAGTIQQRVLLWQEQKDRHQSSDGGVHTQNKSKDDNPAETSPVHQRPSNRFFGTETGARGRHSFSSGVPDSRVNQLSGSGGARFSLPGESELLGGGGKGEGKGHESPGRQKDAPVSPFGFRSRNMTSPSPVAAHDQSQSSGGGGLFFLSAGSAAERAKTSSASVGSAFSTVNAKKREAQMQRLEMELDKVKSANARAAAARQSAKIGTNGSTPLALGGTDSRASVPPDGHPSVGAESSVRAAGGERRGKGEAGRRKLGVSGDLPPPGGAPSSNGGRAKGERPEDPDRSRRRGSALASVTASRSLPTAPAEAGVRGEPQQQHPQAQVGASLSQATVESELSDLSVFRPAGCSPFSDSPPPRPLFLAASGDGSSSSRDNTRERDRTGMEPQYEEPRGERQKGHSSWDKQRASERERLLLMQKVQRPPSEGGTTDRSRTGSGTTLNVPVPRLPLALTGDSETRFPGNATAPPVTFQQKESSAPEDSRGFIEMTGQSAHSLPHQAEAKRSEKVEGMRVLMCPVRPPPASDSSGIDSVVSVSATSSSAAPFTPSVRRSGNLKGKGGGQYEESLLSGQGLDHNQTSHSRPPRTFAHFTPLPREKFSAPNNAPPSNCTASSQPHGRPVSDFPEERGSTEPPPEDMERLAMPEASSASSHQQSREIDGGMGPGETREGAQQAQESQEGPQRFHPACRQERSSFSRPQPSPFSQAARQEIFPSNRRQKDFTLRTFQTENGCIEEGEQTEALNIPIPPVHTLRLCQQTIQIHPFGTNTMSALVHHKPKKVLIPITPDDHHQCKKPDQPDNDLSSLLSTSDGLDQDLTLTLTTVGVCATNVPLGSTLLSDILCRLQRSLVPLTPSHHDMMITPPHVPGGASPLTTDHPHMFIPTDPHTSDLPLDTAPQGDQPPLRRIVAATLSWPPLHRAPLLQTPCSRFSAVSPGPGPQGDRQPTLHR